MKIKIDKSQLITTMESDKAFALKFSRNSVDVLFLPKKLTKVKTIENRKDGFYWSTDYELEFPDWLFEKLTDPNKVIIKLIQDQWKPDNNL
tara:strand:- start:231 stop:503 length:273 start_codon:yes stop_codon:yes gene_type:complete